MRKAALWILLFFLSGCAGLKTISPLTLEEFLSEQNERLRLLSKTHGKAHIRFSDSRGSLFGESRLVRYLEKSRFEVRDPMGRVRLWIVANDQGLLIYEADSQKAWKAPKGSSTYFKKRFGILLSWEELQDLWLGVLPKSWREKGNPTWEQKTGHYEGVFSQGNPIHFWVDASSRQLKQVFWKNKNQAVQISFSDWDACSALEIQKKLLAHRVVMDLPPESNKFELEWEELNLLEESPNEFNFRGELPKGTRLVPLKE